MHAVLSVLLASLLCATEARGDDWPQWRGAGRDGVWRESGIIEKFDKPQIDIVWRQPIGPGYSGPTVADGRVFITDRQSEPEQVERVHCFDAATGEPQWSHSYACRYTIQYTAGPRACVTVDGDRAFALGAMGNLHCLDVIDGSVVWKRDLNSEYRIHSPRRDENRMPIWGIAAAPLVVGDSLVLHIGGSDGACVVALDKRTGEEKWRALADRAQYSAPILIEQADRQVIVCWTGDNVAGLDADTGEVCWRIPMKPKQMPIGIATPIVEGNRLFVTSFYDGSLMLELAQDSPSAKVLWRRVGPSEQETDALHSTISTPLMVDGYLYGDDSYGELRCLDAATGERIWEDQTATPRDRWSNIHFVQNGKRVWMFNERGELIISRLSPQGFEEISRAKLIEPTTDQLERRGKGVCWSHPAFANRHVFARNDKEIVCASLAAD
jgi:outer membrane protein assembly factor BamB